MAERFAGKCAIVTGTTGIGAACAIRLAQEGACVVALGIDEVANAALNARAGALDVLAIPADIRVPADVEEGVAALRARGGGVDIVVNSAAIHPYGSAVDTPFDTVKDCLEVNVGGVFLTAKYAVPHMRERGGGAIVNLSSVQGFSCQAGVAAYVASKGAVHALTRAMALELAGDKIRVTSVSPGSVRTPILELAARTFDGEDADIDAAFRRFGEAHPIGRIAEPEEVAGLIAFLVSDEGQFISGSDHKIDGALTAGIGVR